MINLKAIQFAGLGEELAPSFTVSPVWRVLAVASTAVSAYHGYKRNARGAHPVGWAIGWGVLGMIAPVLTPVVAFAQGFAKPKKS